MDDTASGQLRISSDQSTPRITVQLASFLNKHHLAWRRGLFWCRGLCLLTLLFLANPVPAATVPLKSCWLKGVVYPAMCGMIQRPLVPSEPQGQQIDVHFAVIPALARNKKPDPLFFFAGGPGQSALTLAGQLQSQYSRFSNSRDLVFVDQRGTGQSAPLYCDQESPTRLLGEALVPEAQIASAKRCLSKLQSLPYGDLRQFTTSIAVGDIDAVRDALGYRQINAIGFSYGTRAVLEYLRQFPDRVRRAVIDGVAPPDMALPAAFSTDAQAAFDAVLAACEAEAACATRFPDLRQRWQAMLNDLPGTVTLTHPITGQDETISLSREMLTGLVRQPLYMSMLASALPSAMMAATEGRFGPLLGLASVLAGNRDSDMRLATGMHYSVICSEDMPLLPSTTDRPGKDFGTDLARQYEKVCADWPRGQIPAGFYRIPAATSPVLVLSGGIDPVTPARHGAKVAAALGGLARHVVVPNAGHGVMNIGCMHSLTYRFINAESATQATQVDTGCAAEIPRPLAFQPLTTSVTTSSETQLQPPASP